jgi:DNA-binding PadR family transcriptional regulator
MGNLRMTTPRLVTLRTLLEDPGREWYGLELAIEVGLDPGTIYPILAAFENAGWVRRRDEDVDPHVAGRPRRRYYALTPAGVGAARAALAGAQRRRGHARAAEGMV